MPRRRSQSGLTLIEVLIAVSLVSLLTLGMMWAIRIGLNSLGKMNDKLTANRRVTGAQRILEQQIYGLIPTSAEPTPGRKLAFFQGEPQSMRFISSYSLQEGSRGHAQILAYHVIPGDEGVGVRLVVEETPFTGGRSAGALITGRAFDPALGRAATTFVPIETTSHSFVLADRLASCRFSYQEVRPRPELQRWVPFWQLEQWPDAIRIELEPLPDSGRALHMLTVIAPVHVTRSATEVYDDNY